MSKEAKRLLINLLALGIILVGLFFLYTILFGDGKDDLTIDDTPIQIESIETIAEISTISYRDEVVIDTVELYEDDYSYYDPRKWFELYDHGVKRRLTLIVKGEVIYGLDLKDDDYTVESNADTLWLHLPAPRMLEVIVTPSATEVFQEKGTWGKGTRRQLEIHAKQLLEENASALELEQLAKENAERLFQQLVQTEKTLVIDFIDHE